MAINSKHPSYADRINDWIMMRDTYDGERQVKERGTVYLPATAGMLKDGMEGEQPGRKAYESYKMRAVFYDFVSDAVEAMIGLLHSKEAVVELPAAMEPMRESCTPHNESILTLLRRINEEQLVTGRLGLLLDVDENPNPTQPLPWISIYTAESIINWDEGPDESDMDIPKLNLVVLDESGPERVGMFNWEVFESYRVLVYGAPEDNSEQSSEAYRQGYFSNRLGGLTFSEEALIEPQIRGSVLDQIPFVFINSKDIVPTPDNPPLIGLARLALAIYRGEADYRQHLFMQSQDTLVVIGSTLDEDEDDTIRTGAGAYIPLAEGGDAKYIGVNSQGLPEQRTALENDKKMALNKSGNLIDTSSGQRESGEALTIRLAAQTATLNQIALAGAAGLERILRVAAKWLGADPKEVSVTPNLEFADQSSSSREFVELMTARGMGLPISKRSIHQVLAERGYTKLDYESEVEEMGEEEPAPSGTAAGGNPGQDEDFGQMTE